MNRRTGWALPFLLLAVAGAVWRLADPVENEPVEEPTTSAVVQPLPTLEPAPPVEPVDAGTFPPLVDPEPSAIAPPPLAEGGGFTTTPPKGFDLETYVRRWREALEPLMGWKAPARRATIRVADQGKPFQREPDGGVPPCVAGQVVRVLSRPLMVDVVVFIDTSGSMDETLPAIAQWLGKLEFSLRQASRDFQLIVVADRQRVTREARRFPPARVDSGYVEEFINSNDMLDVLLRSAESPTGWASAMRPGVARELILVTDDSPFSWVSTKDYAPRLAQLFGADEKVTRLHVMGGFEVGKGRLLGPDDSLAAMVCRPHGVSPGLVYQRLSKMHRGTRASICDDWSRDSLFEVVLESQPPPIPCSFELELHPEATLQVPRVVQRRMSEPLLREYSEAACPGLRRSFLPLPNGIRLCPSTCEALREDRVEALELSWTCR